MNTIYLVDNGLKLQKCGHRILVKKGGVVTQELPVINVKRLLVFGNNQITTELLRYLAAHGIEVAFLSSRRRFRFRLVPETSKNIYLRIAQHNSCRSDEFKISFSKTVVRTKIKNMRSMLVRYHRNQPDKDIDEITSKLNKYAFDVSRKNTIEEIMGLEGIASRTYFEGFGKFLPEEFEFIGRTYHPPSDPVNALLGFGYMLLLGEIESQLEARGFDVFLGIFHGTQYGRASLACDLIEELRSPLVDRMVLYLLNKKMISPDQFSDEKESAGMRMNDRARRIFLQNYERFVTASFIDPSSSRETTYQHIISDRVTALENLLLHEAQYKPFLFY